MMVRVAVFAAIVTACNGTTVEPRVDHNRGLAAMESGALEDAYKDLLAARDQAGADNELRFSAAMALGHTKARLADSVEVAEPAAAVSHLRESSAWFQDALRLRPQNQPARKNLEKILRRIQILADKLNEDGGLEGELTRIIEDQRSLRDSIRELLSALDKDEVRDPVGYRDQFIALATRQRDLLASVGALTDRAGDERDGIEGKAEDERDQGQKVRLLQLDALVHYLERGRSEQADGRRSLRKLAAGDSLADASAALHELKRGREQLLDPIAVLRTIASEEMQLVQHTAQLEQLSQQPSMSSKIPAWLNSERLMSRQDALAARAAELGARFAGASANEGDGSDELPTETRRLLEAASKAAPLIAAANTAMTNASSELADGDVAAAVPLQQDSITRLLAAAELFADIRTLVELSHESQRHTDAILSRGDEENSPAQTLSPSEQKRQVDELSERNTDRLSRLATLLEDELSRLKAAMQEQGNGGDEAAAGLQAEAQRVEEARRLRDLAAATLEKQRRAATSADVRDMSAQTLKHLDELRRLYFSIVEHIKELRMAQAQTHDRTVDAEDKSDEDKLPSLGPLADSQGAHLERAEALTEALEGQADAAAGSPEGAEQSERLGQAAEEMRKAILSMDDATQRLRRARDDAMTMSVSLAEIIASQPEAIAHMDEALRLLSPPQDQKNQDQKNQDQENQDQKNQDQENQDQENQDQQAKGQAPSPGDEKVSQQEAQRRLEAIREREAERRRRNNAQIADDPVEKDW